MCGLLLFSLTSTLLFIETVKADIIVNTDLGKVAGIEVKSIIKDEKYYSFMSIPYGKAPIGPLRFQAPEPHEGWTDVRKAKKERLPCTQYNLPIITIKNYGVFGQDDCLHLSVHTPKLPSDNESLNLPVIVFLYNELFRMSYNASNDFGPDFFVKEDVVIVMISHRLGAAGFLAYEDEVLPGNNGLRDVILALKWIQRNIHNFGGDALSITVMGSNGGAALVDILLLSPKAKGLFNKAIMQSGTSWQSIYFPKSPKVKANSLLNHFDKSSVTSTDVISKLASLSAAEIASAEISDTMSDEARTSQRGKLYFGPVIEPDHPDAIITKLPEEGPLKFQIPILMGYNSRESLHTVERFLHKPQFLTYIERDLPLNFPTRDNFYFDLDSQVYEQAIQEIKNFYFDEGYVKISKPGEYMTYVTDMMYFYPLDYALRKYLNESSSQVYYYTFDYSGELNMIKNQVIKGAKTIEGTWGATTGDELCYLFVCKSIKKTYKKVLEDEESEELKVIRNMIKLWTNFAKSGNPTPPGSDFIWTPATKENKECLVISDELEVKKNLHQERIDFWDNFIAKYKAMTVKGILREKDEL